MRPELIKPKMIKVVYADYAAPTALEPAEKHDIWILNWRSSLTPRKRI